MQYQSTRGGEATVSAPQAILNGLAQDGGLYLPTEIPKLDESILSEDLSYATLAERILTPFLSEFENLGALCREAYATGKFDTEPPVPLHALADNLFCQELYHGPTCAFKDMALQLMPRLLRTSLALTGETRTAVVLTATSGDTGKAALAGFCGVDQTKILVFYPDRGVSPLQKRQMTTQEGDNVAVQAISGNFDDAQTAVKAIFKDEALREALAPHAFLTSANSINFARLVPQIVYYVSAYRSLLRAKAIRLGDPVNFCVPTGNFGNIFACYLAKKMGLPIGKLLCASNSNNVLTDFLERGVYDKNRRFYTTISPSMDILVSSNLERLLCLAMGSARTKALMASLASTGSYTLSPEEKALLEQDFFGAFCSEDDTRAALREVFEQEQYLVDPHTAVGLYAAKKYRRQTGDSSPLVCASTASAFKFPQSVLSALGKEAPADEFEALCALSRHTGAAVPPSLAALSDKTVRFTGVLNKDEMRACVERFARS